MPRVQAAAKGDGEVTAEQTVIEGTSRELVISEPDEQKAIVLMDRMDLEQALAELRGDVVSKFVYVAKGKRQLSYAGVKEAARLYRNVHFGATATPLADGSWMITSYAHNLADNTRVDYPMPYPSFNAADAQEAISFRANLSKSLRNALAAVLPISYLETMILRWVDQTTGKRPEPQRANPAATARNITPQGEPRELRPATPQGQAQTAAADPLAAQRAELAALIAFFPDVVAAMKGAVLADAKVPEALAKLRARKEAEPARWVASAGELLERYGAEAVPTSAEEIARCRAEVAAGQRLLPDIVEEDAAGMKAGELADALDTLWDAAVLTWPDLFDGPEQPAPAGPAITDDIPF